MSISDAENLVLRTVGLVSPPSGFVVEHALRYRSGFSGYAHVAEDDIVCAVSTALDRGLIQIVDARVISEIQSNLAHQNCHGPVFGLPRIGCLDLTNSGACEWRTSVIKDTTNLNYSVVLERHFKYYCMTADGARRVISAARRHNKLAICGPTPIGQWQLAIWETFPKGYVIDVIEPNVNLLVASINNLQFDRGVCHDLFSEFSRLFLDQIQARTYAADKSDTLVSAEEGLCLALISGVFGYGNMVTQMVERCLGHVLMEYQGQFLTEPEKCVERLQQKGLIRFAPSDCNELLQRCASNETSDIIILPFPIENTLALTSNGFAELSSILSKYWKNGGWQEYVVGEQVVEESLLEYYQSHNAALNAAEKYKRNSNVCLVSKIEPIEVWCANWWHVMQRGYRIRVRSVLYDSCDDPKDS